MPKNIVFVLIVYFLVCYSAIAENRSDTLTITLDESISRAALLSVDAVVAKNEYRSSYWEYRTYQSELLPEIIFNGTLPYYSKSYNQYQKEDGTYTFVSNDYSRVDAGLSITQNIPLTGGKISLESTMQQLKQYGGDKSANWKVIPYALTLEQPIFGFNSTGWKKRIMPIKKIESERKLVAEIEKTSNTAVIHYFDLLLGKANMDIARQNMENTQKLYKIAEARNKIGQISENDLMQLKVSLLNAQSALIDAESLLNARMFDLRSFLGYDQNIVLEPVIPAFLQEDIPSIQYSRVQDLVNQNNAFTQNVKRRILEASRDVSEAKSDRWDIKLYASFGRVGQNDVFSNTFKSDYIRNNQIIELGVKIPILDWGKRKGQVKIAEANREVINSKLEKEIRDFNQQVFLTVQNFNNQPKQLRVAQETDLIARKRYETCIEAFILGKMDVLNLNDAQSAKDIAWKNYIEQLFYLWSYYYQIRSLTLYDFIRDKELTVDYDSLIKN